MEVTAEADGKSEDATQNQQKGRTASWACAGNICQAGTPRESMSGKHRFKHFVGQGPSQEKRQRTARQRDHDSGGKYTALHFERDFGLPNRLTATIHHWNLKHHHEESNSDERHRRFYSTQNQPDSIQHGKSQQ